MSLGKEDYVSRILGLVIWGRVVVYWLPGRRSTVWSLHVLPVPVSFGIGSLVSFQDAWMSSSPPAAPQIQHALDPSYSLQSSTNKQTRVREAQRRRVVILGQMNDMLSFNWPSERHWLIMVASLRAFECRISPSTWKHKTTLSLPVNEMCVVVCWPHLFSAYKAQLRAVLVSLVQKCLQQTEFFFPWCQVHAINM